MSGFRPFGFLRQNVDPQWWAYYWLVYYVWIWLAAAARFHEERIRTLRDVVLASRDGRLLDLEFLAVAAIVGAVPGLFLTGYSSVHYFSEYQHWLALGLLLSIILRRPILQEVADPAREAVTNGVRDRWGNRVAGAMGRLTLGRVLAGVFVVGVAGTLVSNAFVLVRGMTAANLAARGRPEGRTGLGLALLHGRWREADRVLQETARGVETQMRTDKNVLAVLSLLDAMPLTDKRASVLFIPRSNRQFWDLLHGPYASRGGPLVAPALSGVAMIDGLPDFDEKDSWLEYGYRSYPRPGAAYRQASLDVLLPALRARCAKLGFRKLIVISQARNGFSEARTYDCPN